MYRTLPVANRGLVRTNGWNRSGFFFTAAMKCFVLNVSECTGGCFTATFFQTQQASFSGQCSGRSAIGGGNETRKNIPACAHERQDNRTATSLGLLFQPSAQIMDVDFKIFDSEILITDEEKSGHYTSD
jgi:hypothetical protein